MKKNMFLTSRVNIIILFTMIFMLSGIVCSMAQISGTVVDNEGIPIIGANIIEEGTTNGTVTDIDGKFTLEIADNAVLRVSYIGYLEQTIETKGRTTINITLLEDTQALEEVVVVGYGTMKRSSLTGSVSRVETEQIEAFPSTNVVDALQGQAAGVYITPSRQPGESPSIRIRGSRSLSAGNNPLLIIDGMPGSWDNLVNQDIESMEILKDAAATAIYGSRAANGVVLVTTKAARDGISKVNIEVNSFIGLNDYDFIKMQSAEKYAELIRDVMRYQTHGAMNAELWQNSSIDTKRGMEMFNSTWAENYYNKGINYNWQEALFDNTSFNQGHSIAISNRSDRMSYRLSYNFQEDNSYYKTVNFQRHVLSSNVDLKITDWLDFGMINRLMYRKHTGWPDNMWDNLRRMTPFETPYIDEDPSKGFKDAVGKEKYVNALWNYEKGYLVQDRVRKMADIILKLEAKPLDWLTLTTNLKIDVNEGTSGNYRDSKTSYQNLGLNSASMEKSSGLDYSWNGIINIQKEFNESHNIMATGVIEAIQDKNEWLGGSAQNIPAQYMDYHFLESGIVNRNLWSGFEKTSLLSYMFRGQYEYNGKYLLNAAVRVDGSSRLAEGNQWRTFPSMSAAWVVTEEDFMKNQNILTVLKLRASYGEVGNQAISPYQTLTTLTQGAYSWAGNGIYTWRPSGIANTNLGWEVSKTWNFGLDFNLLRGKLSGGIELYQTINEDLLMERSLPGSTGFSSIWQNIGKTKNEGIELSLSSNIISRNDLNWTISAMASRNWNEIIDLADGKDNRSEGWFIGQPIRVTWDYKKIGIWQIDEADEARKYKMEPGQIKVIDRDGDFAFTDNDRFILGQREPKVIASLQNSLRYKNLDFSFNVVGQFGHLIQAGNYTAEWNGDKMIIDAINWWTPLNPTNDWPRAQTAQSNSYTSTLSIFDGDFIKMQNISLGYDLSKLVSNMNINKLRIYVQASNPFYIYKAAPSDVNPEQPNTMYTIPSSYVMGVNFNF
ncbi:MAG: TonB-dependent receptor [Fermentimonas sp.]|nr:TonB-dependent receptor [Fermentimonas sp.]MDD4008399.1 TonB-dependent receptor [Fermentimonas sp.]MDD4697141.1 TonB-dependent receptor [Fermentimonas sp.]